MTLLSAAPWCLMTVPMVQGPGCAHRGHQEHWEGTSAATGQGRSPVTARGVGTSHSECCQDLNGRLEVTSWSRQVASDGGGGTPACVRMSGHRAAHLQPTNAVLSANPSGKTKRLKVTLIKKLVRLKIAFMCANPAASHCPSCYSYNPPRREPGRKVRHRIVRTARL